MTTAVDKWPACTRLLAVAPAGHLPTTPTPLLGTRPGLASRIYELTGFYLMVDCLALGCSGCPISGEHLV
jgi:hypothetical protein